MLITSMTPRGKSKTVLELDYEYRLVIPNRDAARNALSEGEELPEALYLELLEQRRSELNRRCAQMLRERDYTEQVLTHRLCQDGYPRDMVEETVAAAKETGMVDDRRFAENFLRIHMEDRSLSRIRSDLLKKGVSESLIEAAFAAWEETSCAPDDDAEDRNPAEAAELRQIRGIFRKRRYDPKTAGQEERNRMTAYLQYRGYPPDMIRAAMDRP